MVPRLDRDRPVSRPLLVLAGLLLVLAAAPAGAAAAPPYVPGEVVVKYGAGSSAPSAPPPARRARAAADRDRSADAQAVGAARDDRRGGDHRPARRPARRVRRPERDRAPETSCRTTPAASARPAAGRSCSGTSAGRVRDQRAGRVGQHGRRRCARAARGVIVAVLDTGVAYRQRPARSRRSPELQQGASSSSGYDFVDDDPYADDSNGHGTHVAGHVAEATGRRPRRDRRRLRRARSCRCACSTAPATATPRRSSSGDPLRHRPRREGDQPQPRVLERPSPRRRSPSCSPRSATRTTAAC